MKLVIVLVISLIFNNLSGACKSGETTSYDYHLVYDVVGAKDKDKDCDAFVVPLKRATTSNIFATNAHCLMDGDTKDVKRRRNRNDLRLTGTDLITRAYLLGDSIIDMYPHTDYDPATRTNDAALVKTYCADYNVKGAKRHSFGGADAGWIKEWANKEWPNHMYE